MSREPARLLPVPGSPPCLPNLKVGFMFEARQKCVIILVAGATLQIQVMIIY